MGQLGEGYERTSRLPAPTNGHSLAWWEATCRWEDPGPVSLGLVFTKGSEGEGSFPAWGHRSEQMGQRQWHEPGEGPGYAFVVQPHVGVRGEPGTSSSTLAFRFSHTLVWERSRNGLVIPPCPHSKAQVWWEHRGATLANGRGGGVAGR